MIAAIFQDQELQDRFERDGYVVFDFISAEQAALIATRFYELHDKIPGGFYSTAENPEDSFKKAISDHAESIIAESMEKVFCDYKKLGITFLCKSPGAEGRVPVHRDWMVVDETKYFSGTIWIPTQDVTEANGALRVLPGSHKFFRDLRSSSLPVAFEGYESEIWDQMITVPMKAGQAFLLNHAVIHASSANVTDKERLILVCGITPAAARLSYYHGTGKGTVEKFDMPDDMFMRHSDIGGRPTIGVKVTEFEYNLRPENRLKVQQMITKSKSEHRGKQLFADEELQAKFTENGYLKIQALNAVEVNSIKEMLAKAAAGTLSSDVREMILSVVLPKLTARAYGLKAIDVRLEIKERNTSSLGHLEQELTCVENEERGGSITCWMPLTNVSISNGALAVIAGSQLFLGNVRPSPKELGRFVFGGNELEVFPYLQTIELNAGEVILMDDRLFRTSLPNNSATDVWALSIKLVGPDTRLCHYYLDPGIKGKRMIKYFVDEAFFTKYDNARLTTLYANGVKIEGYEASGVVDYKYPEFTTAELIEAIKSNGTGVNDALKEYLMKNENYCRYIANRAAPVAAQTGPIDVKEEMVVVNNASQGAVRFWNKYTPLNIIREIKRRVSG